MDQSKTNVLVGAFAVGVLVIFAFGAVRLGPGRIGGTRFKPLVIYVPSAQGLYKDSAVRVAGVKVGLVESIGLEKGLARVEIRLQSDVELFPNARATVKSEGLLGDRYIEIEPGSADPEEAHEKAGPPESKGARVIYADESSDISQVTEQLGRTGKNLEAITDNLRNVLESKPGGNEDLARTLKALARLTENLADVTGENRQDLREIVIHLKQISRTLDRETPGVTEDLRKLVQDLQALVDSSREDVKETLESFRQASERFDRTLSNVEEITRKINEGQGTIGKLVNDDTTVEEVNRALKGINNYLEMASRIELRLGYRAEIQPRQENAKSVVGIEVWPKPDKYYFFNLISNPAGNRPSRRTSTITNDCAPLASCGLYPASVTQTTASSSATGINFSLGIGKRFEYATFFGGFIESSGGVGMSLSPDRYKHWDFELTAYDFNRQETNRPILKARASFYFWKYFYLTGGVEDILAENQDDVIPFGGGGISFVDEDLKPLLKAAPVSAAAGK